MGSLNLGDHGLHRDLRKLILRKLDAFDMAMVEAAHTSTHRQLLSVAFAMHCVRNGHLSLL